jgi:hypothetical protein
VRPAAGARLAPGDLVVVGFRDGDRALAAGGAKGGP